MVVISLLPDQGERLRRFWQSANRATDRCGWIAEVEILSSGKVEIAIVRLEGVDAVDMACLTSRQGPLSDVLEAVYGVAPGGRWASERLYPTGRRAID
jgi:hypothetical protein